MLQLYSRSIHIFRSQLTELVTCTGTVVFEYKHNSLYSCTLYSYSIPYEYSYSEPRYLRSADQLKNCTNVHRFVVLARIYYRYTVQLYE